VTSIYFRGVPSWGGESRFTFSSLLCWPAHFYFCCICPTQKSSSFTESPGSRRRFLLINSTYTTNPERPITFQRPCLSSLDTVLSSFKKMCSSDNTGWPVTYQAARCHTAENLDVHCAYVMSYLKFLHLAR
jgi:hypothetical protein